MQARSGLRQNAWQESYAGFSETDWGFSASPHCPWAWAGPTPFLGLTPASRSTVPVECCRREEQRALGHPSRQVRWLQITADPAEPGRVPPPVLFETHIRVDLDDEQRLGRCVVHEIPGSCPDRDDGIRSGHGWARCGG